jgi:two-component system, NarL family, nitrate/nitrite response regulator NarL
MTDAATGRSTTARVAARVVVVDDHPFFRDGLSRGLRESGYLRVVGEAGTGPDGLELIRELRPDVAVLDYQLPGLTGLEIVHAIVRDQLPTRSLMLSAITEGALVFQALQEGANGYLSKDARRAEIVDAVLRVARGETVVPAELAAGLAEQIRRQGPSGAPTLTERELQVLKGFARGLTVPALAAELFLGASTVKTHAQKVYEKLGVSDRAAAVAEAMRQGLLE